jgi:hypothetical protein
MPSAKDVFQISRGDWVLDINKANKATYILPHYRGRILYVFENNDNWKIIVDSKDASGKSRKRYEGKMITIKNSGLDGKKIPGKWLKSTGNPIRYTTNIPKSKNE